MGWWEPYGIILSMATNSGHMKWMEPMAKSSTKMPGVGLMAMPQSTHREMAPIDQWMVLWIGSEQSLETQLEWMDIFPIPLFLLKNSTFWDRGRHLDTKLICQNIHRAVIIWQRQRLVLVSHMPILNRSAMLEGTDKLIHSSLAIDWQLQLQFSGNLTELCNELKENHGFAMSDGSYWDWVGMAAWIIKGSTLQSRVIRTIITPTGLEDQSSFWSKLVGIYWQEMNGFNNTNNESALMKQFKTNGCVGLQGGNNNDSRTNDRKAPDEPPEGSWWTKVSTRVCYL